MEDKEIKSELYWDKLLYGEAKQRYLDKSKTISDTDPYELAAQEWITDPDIYCLY